MPNIAAVLKSEIARVARKENKSGGGALKRASAQYRADIAALKRRVTVLERQIAKVSKSTQRSIPLSAPEADLDEGAYRWRPDGFKKLRAKLGLSASDMGKLIGCSGQSIYKWEDGKARPRAKHLPAIAAARKMGKREVVAKLAEMS